ncbi:MAG: hydrogenase nickel incorporation protein HypB [Candidatus Latescibacterota bacterium]
MKSSGKRERIQIVSKVLKANDRVAEQNKKIFTEAHVYAIDLIGSPGSGKTALLEATIPLLLSELRVGVIEGDISTCRDAERIAALGVPVVQITTEAFGGSCHLEASTVGQALEELTLQDLDLLFIENVGNLVCPAEFDIGQHARVVVFSITEGEDKPLKYPLAFREADLIVVNKIDLTPYQKPDMDALRQNIERINPKVPRIELSARSGSGLEPWISWIRNTSAGAY